MDQPIANSGKEQVQRGLSDLVATIDDLRAWRHSSLTALNQRPRTCLIIQPLAS